MSMSLKNVIGAILLLIVGLTYGYLGTQLPDRGIPNVPGPSFFPKVVALLIVLLAISLLIKGLIGLKKEPAMIGAFSVPVWPLLMLAWWLGFVILLLSASIGLMIVTIGQDPMMGTARFTFGDADMLSGLHFLTALIGLFAVPQLVESVCTRIPLTRESQDARGFGRVIPRMADFKRILVPVSIGGPIGSFLGVLPGAGGPIAAFISYDYAKKASKKPKEFGKGSVEGIAAPESANNGVTGGVLIPMMTLGIPGDPVTAILIGALLVHGLAPGPMLFLERGDFAYGLIFSFFVANIFNLIIAFAGIG